MAQKTFWFAVFVAISLSMPTQVRADVGAPCHFHGKKIAADSVIVVCANARRDALVKSGKLPATWAQIKHDTLAQVSGKKGMEWKVRYSNPTATDPSKQALFMFFTLPGNFIAANHTGE